MDIQREREYYIQKTKVSYCYKDRMSVCLNQIIKIIHSYII